MNVKSTPEKYGVVAMSIHWISSILVVAALTFGFWSKNSIGDALKIVLLQWHLPLAVVLFVLTIARVLWWLLVDRRPAPIDGLPTWQRVLSSAVHYLMYAAILTLGVSGIVIVRQSGIADIIFGSSAAALPDFWQYAARYVHAFTGKALFVLVSLHILGAVYHRFIRKDGVTARMGL